MKKTAIAFAIVIGFGLAGIGTAHTEAASPFGFHFSRGGIRINVGHGHHRGYRSYGVQHFGGNHYGGHYDWHNTTHYDWHPGQYYRHGNHFDYVPGHYDLHRSGHYDYHRGSHRHYRHR